MVYGQCPFRGANFMETYSKIRNDPVDFAPNGKASVSGELVDLLTGLLEKDPRRRMTLEEALAHPWTASGGGGGGGGEARRRSGGRDDDARRRSDRSDRSDRRR